MLMCCVSLSIVAHLNILNCNVYRQSIIVIPLEVYTGTLVSSPVQRHDRGMTDDIATTTNITCQWSSEKQMFRNYWPSHDIILIC
jgi:hypothetical protein